MPTKTMKKTQAVTPMKKSTLKAGPKKAAAPSVQFKAPTNDVEKTASVRKGKSTPAKATTKTTTAKKAPAKKAAPSPVETDRRGREMDEHGFVVGSDSSKIAAILLEGGSGRAEVNEKIAAAIASPTRYGNDKNVSSLVSGLLARLKERGYTVEQTWKVVPPSQTVAAGSSGTGSTPATKRPSKAASSASKKGSRK